MGYETLSAHFSPTGEPRKSATALPKALTVKETISLLPAQGSVSALALTENDVVILGVPAFGGEFRPLSLIVLRRFEEEVQRRFWWFPLAMEIMPIHCWS